MSITTTLAHVNRAKEFFKKDDVYFAIGKTSPWTNEEQPPSPSASDTTLQEIIGFKKVDTKHIVVMDNVNGTIEYQNQKFRIITEANAAVEGAKWVYLSATIKFDELPLGQYRQIGVYTGVTKKSTVASGKYNLLPSEVQSAGSLEVINNRKVASRQADQKETLSIVIEF